VPSLIDHLKSVLDQEPSLAIEFSQKLPYFEQVAELINWSSGASPEGVTPEGDLIARLLVGAPPGGGRFLERLSASLRRSGRDIADELRKRLYQDSPGLYQKMPTDRRILTTLRFIHDHSVAVSVAEVQEYSSKLLSYWITSNTTKATAVDIAEIAYLFPYEIRLYFEELLENIHAWMDVGLDDIDDHVLRYKFHLITESDGVQMIELRDDFMAYARGRLSAFSSEDDVEEMPAVVKALVDGATELKFYLSLVEFPRHAEFLAELNEYYAQLIGHAPIATARPATSSTRPALTGTELQEISSMFDTLNSLG
jgi:hypothetical protein